MPLQQHGLHGTFAGLGDFVGDVSVFKVLFRVEALCFKKGWLLQMVGEAS